MKTSLSLLTIPYISKFTLTQGIDLGLGLLLLQVWLTGVSMHTGASMLTRVSMRTGVSMHTRGVNAHILGCQCSQGCQCAQGFHFDYRGVNGHWGVNAHGFGVAKVCGSVSLKPLIIPLGPFQIWKKSSIRKIFSFCC
jgi:hypothetical protein